MYMAVDLQEQATVAIIGGGLSGLVCAQECARQGLKPTVFDTGTPLLM